nr:MAG TPA: hypothetical protein [Bacteriophage sp.]
MLHEKQYNKALLKTMIQVNLIKYVYNVFA